MSIKETGMKTEDLKIVLEKYHNGDISEQEEILLRDCFKYEEVPEKFRIDKEIFDFYLSEDKIPGPSVGFEERLMASTDSRNVRKGETVYRRLILSAAGIAAGILVILGSWFFITRSGSTKDTFTDPELAYAEVMKILYDVSYRLNQGTAALEPMNRMQEITAASLGTIKKSTVKIEENLKTLKYFTRDLEKLNLKEE